MKRFSKSKKLEGQFQTFTGSMVSTRRKFEQALNNDPKRAEYALKKIQELYFIESKAREDEPSYDQRKELRQKESLPILKIADKGDTCG